MSNSQTHSPFADKRPIGVLFDCDGVLVDSEPALAEIAALALQDYGAAATPDDFKPYIGTGEDRYLGEVAAKYGVTMSDAIKEHVYQKYHELASVYVHPFPGIQDLLLKLKSAGYRIAVVSSADQVKLETNLAVLGLPKTIFDTVISGSDIERKKPFPDIYLMAASKCGLEPARCFVVEDAVSGVESGKAAGMFCIGFTSSHTADELREAGADVIVDDIREVWKIVSAHFRYVI